MYPLALLVSWFGPVERVRVADALDVWPEREERRPSTPSHVEATLAFAAGPTVRLTASFYAPHRSREFYGLELHGDDGSLYLKGTGSMGDDRDAVRRLVEELRTVVDRVRLVRLAVVEGPDATEQVTFDLSALTPKQRRGLELAVVRGYFDDDRDVRLSELADELGISKSALSQRLRTAQAKLVTDVFDGAERPDPS